MQTMQDSNQSNQSNYAGVKRRPKKPRQFAKRERWLFGAWVRRMLMLSDMRYTELRDILGIKPATFSKYTKQKPGVGYIEIPHVKVIAEMAIAMNVPISDAMVAAGEAVTKEAKASLRNRGYGDLVNLYEHTHEYESGHAGDDYEGAGL